MLTHTSHIAFDGLGDVGNRFFPGSTLGVAPWKSRTTDYNETIFILFEGNGELQDSPLFADGGR